MIATGRHCKNVSLSATPKVSNVFKNSGNGSFLMFCMMIIWIGKWILLQERNPEEARRAYLESNPTRKAKSGKCGGKGASSVDVVSLVDVSVTNVTSRKNARRVKVANDEHGHLDMEEGVPKMVTATTTQDATVLVKRSMNAMVHGDREAQGFSGGIWVMWGVDVPLDVLQVSTQFIHCRCRSINKSKRCYLAVVYKSPTTSRRKLF
ncbi:hypothetical protein V6N13_024861 [Hibiscus sabdariffa]